MDLSVENNVKELRRSKEEKKILRKQLKASHTLLKHEGIVTASQPTKSLVVANGGLGNGVSREELLSALKGLGELEMLIMPPQKPYAFVTYRSEESAQKAHFHLNGQQMQCGGNIVTLYLSYVNSVTCPEEEGVPVLLPEGLTLLEDFVSPEEETLLLTSVDWSSTNDSVTAQKALKHRKVKHYGFEFRYDNNNVDKDKPLPCGIPQECLPVLERCVRSGHILLMPDQLTVNQYECGQGIPPHVDTHSAFEDTIMSLSLGAQTVMEFRHPDGRLIPVVLPPRSLLLMKGESRYLWTHGITPRKFDTLPACDPQPSADFGTHSNLTLSKRGTRTSFTFRKIRNTPCDCAFPSACDSQGASSVPTVSTPMPPSLPCSHTDAALLEEQYVHRVYDSIASHFSSTRHSPWPRVCQFLDSLPAGSVLADVGCGNGKYLAVNPDVFAVGCDRSSALVQICADRGFQAFVSDALRVPLRAASCDACISIAVIHHFSTQDRRLAAVREMVRLLKPGGRALIYVWAFEQEYNKQRSKYLKDQNKEPPESHSPVKYTSDNNQEPLKDDCRPGDNLHDLNKVTDGKLSVHKNRTAFNTQDLLVPWHLKEGKGRGEGESGEEEKKGKSKKTLGKPCPTTNPDSKPFPDIDTTQTSTVKQKSESEKSSAPIFHRYYHVFQQGELEQLCRQVAGVKVESSYHDQGNWCVVLEKDEVTHS
ncbi:tRNA (carboxymethyluridine(34)-5-O)-methyltransferase alkbh8 [Halichoeres trimaculatus]|uniref:tRNA (carboxymethyluridine(34)-5-O)-methyltransferase alkbh8 n=1 Tax=Halichoeres trimaculatus TaxID=147232 RepID=UPI003D9EE738